MTSAHIAFTVLMSFVMILIYINLAATTYIAYRRIDEIEKLLTNSDMITGEKNYGYMPA